MVDQDDESGWLINISDIRTGVWLDLWIMYILVDIFSLLHIHVIT